MIASLAMWLNRNTQVLLICGVIAVVVSGGFLAWTLRPLPPVADSARQIAHLTGHITRLEQSVQRNDPEDGSIKEYIHILNDISSDCDKIISLSDRIVADPAISKSDTELSIASRDVCRDLMKLANDSQMLYHATEPVMSIRSNIRFYQTLPLINDYVRSNHMATIDALDPRSMSLKNSPGFSSEVPKNAATLKTAASKSSDFTYISALRTFQAQALSERQQFWSAYAGLSGLKRELRAQADRYCRSDSAKSTSFECR